MFMDILRWQISSYQLKLYIVIASCDALNASELLTDNISITLSDRRKKDHAYPPPWWSLLLSSITNLITYIRTCALSCELSLYLFYYSLFDT